jgi:hypothetical protein
VVCAAAWLLTGCADPSGSEDADETGGASSTTDAGTLATTAGLDEGTTVAASTTDAETTDDSTGGATPVEVQVHTYVRQPMVVDLSFSAADLGVTVVDPLDDGVVAAAIDGAAGETWMRVWGLAPDTSHSLQWTAEGADGDTTMDVVDFVTEAALPGYRAGFSVDGPGAGPDGYVMFDLVEFGPPGPSSIFVVDGEGVTRWHHGVDNDAFDPAVVFAAVTPRPDGSLSFVRQHAIQILDELGDVQLQIDADTVGVPGLHHDAQELPNGNFLAMTYAFEDVVYPGLGLLHVAGDRLLEVTPRGAIVWEWTAFDHLDPQRVRDGFDALVFDPGTGQFAQDWTHGNAVLAEPRTDSVLYSSRHQDWIVRIDRTTGDVVWRFGEDGDFSLDSGQWPYHQHSPQWQADGSLLLYDNGVGNPNLDDALETSRAVRYELDFGGGLGPMTASEAWQDAAEDFMAPIAGDANRLDDGSIMVTDSSIGLADGRGYARLRQVTERSDTRQWTLSTEIGTFAYRSVVSPRLPGWPR